MTEDKYFIEQSPKTHKTYYKPVLHSILQFNIIFKYIEVIVNMLFVKNL